MTSRFEKINKIANLYVEAQNHKFVNVDNNSYTVERLPNNEYKITRYGVIARVIFNDNGIINEHGNTQVLNLAKQDMYKFPKTNEKIKNVTIDNRSYVKSNLGNGVYSVERFGPVGYIEFNSNEILAEVGEQGVVAEIKKDMYRIPKNVFS